MARRPGTAQSLSVPLHTQAEPAARGWLMDVSDSGALSSGHKMYGLAAPQTVPRWRPRGSL